MSESLEDILVLSDMDGTLVTPEQRVAACDLETIRLFTSLGGKFSVASGRAPASVEIFPELTGAISPGITGGGTILYDFQRRVPLKTHTLPSLVALRAYRDIIEAFPELGAMVLAEDIRIYRLAPSPQLDGLFADEKSTVFVRPLEDIPQGWVKVLFSSTPQKLRQVADFVRGRPYPGVYFISTSATYFEMLPEGVSKASSMRKLAKMLGVALENTYVIGDYYNDVEMMRQAGHAVAMENAPPDVRQYADEVTASNREGGVGQFLYKLIRRYAP